MKNRYLLLFLLSSLVVIGGCQKEKSFEGGADPSEGSLLDDGGGNCLPMSVAGTYVIGKVLNGTTEYIEVQVNVTLAGSYTIYTDTANGIYFRGTGVFTSTGPVTVRLRGNGTPVAAGVNSFVVTYGTSGCTVSVTTSGTLAVFTLDGAPGGCLGATPAGTYTALTPLNASNSVTININATVIGAYNIVTAAANGMSFAGSGVITTTGAQAIVLTGSGTPATAGVTTIPVTAGSSSCSFPITVIAAAGAAVFTVNCASAVVNGSYTVGTALTTSNTVTINVSVTTIGNYSLTGTVGGMTFSASASFTITGVQPVTLNATGTPTTAGANTVPLTGGTTPCNFTVTVVPAAGAATFTVNCATAVVNGTYTFGTALTTTNTVTISVNVTAIGSYSISGTAGGMTFAASANFTVTGVQNVTLNGTGTPTIAGANSIPITGGTAPCNFTVTVLPAAGAATFTVNCASAVVNGIYTEGVALTAAANTVSISVNVTVAGSYTITTTATNGMTFSSSGTFAVGLQNVTLTGSGIPAADGTFTIPVPSGTTPCSFDVDVDPAAVSFGTWSLRIGTTNYSGTVYEAIIDNSSPPILFFGLGGDNGATDDLVLGIIDLNGSIVANEQYNCASFTTNSGVFYFLTGTGVSYDADPSMPTNTMIIRVTSHNTATKTIVGTFSGKALLNGTTTLVDITNGQFNVTYP